MTGFAVAGRPVPLVIMGVAGSGKSTIARCIAQAARRVLVEGDDFHPPENILKMRSGIGLSDEDRRGWLDRLAQQLDAHADGVVLSCSALKRSYRDRLRATAPQLRFIFLDIPQPLALDRVAGRGAGHFFSPALVANQFATLEDPSAESGVLRLDAALPRDELTARALAWVADASCPPLCAKEAP